MSVTLPYSHPYVRINWLVGGWIAYRSSTRHVDFFLKYFDETVQLSNEYATEKLPKFSLSYTDEQYKQLYLNWNDFVTKKVPINKILTFNVKDGIEKLAKFCDKPTPRWAKGQNFWLLVLCSKVFTTL